MATVDLINGTDTFVNPNDGIVIVDNFASIRGGRSLNVTGFAPTHIWAGHPIIQDNATKEYKPLPLNGTADGYAALPAAHTYAGILIATIPTSKPFAGILVQGTVNPKAMQFDSTAILSALKTALPLVDFRSDNQ